MSFESIFNRNFSSKQYLKSRLNSPHENSLEQLKMVKRQSSKRSQNKRLKVRKKYVFNKEEQNSFLPPMRGLYTKRFDSYLVRESNSRMQGYRSFFEQVEGSQADPENSFVFKSLQKFSKRNEIRTTFNWNPQLKTII